MFKPLESLLRPGMGLKIIPEIAPNDYEFWNGRMLIWEPPSSEDDYAIGVDVAGGVGSDRSVVQVIRRGDLKRPDEQVAEFASNYHDPVEFADIVAAIGRIYTSKDGDEAFCTMEVNGGYGDTCINELRGRLDYTNLFVWKVYDKRTNLETNRLGWYTTRSTRPKLVARGIHAFALGDIIINSPLLLDEMEDFESDDVIAKAKARFGKHDDRVMALLIGYWGMHDDEWLSGEDIAEKRRLLTDARDVMETKKAENVKKIDWQNSAVSLDRMWADAEAHIFDS